VSAGLLLFTPTAMDAAATAIESAAATSRRLAATVPTLAAGYDLPPHVAGVVHRELCSVGASLGRAGRPLPEAARDVRRRARVARLADEGELGGLQRLLAPLLVHHPDEHFEPMDVDEWLRHATLRHDRDGNPYWDVPGGGGRLRNGTTWDAPVYVHSTTRNGKVYLDYWTFYGYNDKSIDDHVGDWERVAVEVDPRTRRPTHVIFFRHNDRPARLPWGEVQRQGSHPVVYRASGSHASYPSPGHFDIFGPSPDQAADSDHRSPTWRHVHQLDGEPWFRHPPAPSVRFGPQHSKVAGSPSLPGRGGNADPYNPKKPPRDGPPPRDDDDSLADHAIDVGRHLPVYVVGKGVIGLLP
jgi:hypothetical protein